MNRPRPTGPAADRCAACGSDSHVTETRVGTNISYQDGSMVRGVRRRRRCLNCLAAWTTTEIRLPDSMPVHAGAVLVPLSFVSALRRALDMLPPEGVATGLVVEVTP